MTINENNQGKNIPIFQINLSSLSTLLTVLFVGLKLGGVVDWSWWWVVSPLWIPPVALMSAWGVIYLIGRLLFGERCRYNKFLK